MVPVVDTALRRRLVTLGLFLAVGAFFLWEEGLAGSLGALFPETAQVVYPRAGVGDLLLEHAVLVLISSSMATIVGVGLGIFVTRPPGRQFLSVVRDLTSLAQTFPPVAVLALSVPILGFGAVPTVAALFVYSILPIVNNTIAGMESIPRELTEASRGIGMNRRQILLLSELPLAARVITAGIRTAVVINVGTATIGAVVGAGGLGVVIIAGLVRNNLSFVLQGALAAAYLAFFADWFFSILEGMCFSPRELSRKAAA